MPLIIFIRTIIHHNHNLYIFSLNPLYSPLRVYIIIIIRYLLQGCIQLFIVSKESRGLGVGKALVSHLSYYMKTMNVKSLHLYTDTRCNYGFYDSQNFKRLNEKELYFDSIKTNLNIFLYSYNLKYH